MPELRSLFHLFLIAGVLGYSCSSDQGPSPPKTPSKELSTFVTAEELDVELVASEPMVQEPVILKFDPAGRLWVVEMRGFMPNLEGEGEDEPVGRISVLEDLDGDGQMDKSTVFLDSLVLPRSLAFAEGGVLVAEKIPLWYVEDLDGDLVADRKTLIDSTYGGRGFIEHSPNGLLRAMDNWYYNAKAAFRYKQEGGTWRKDETEFRGQWGISQDDYGRLYYNYNWSQLHADLIPPNTFGRNKNHTPTTGIDYGLTLDRKVYPVRSTPAVNRGYITGTLDEDGKLIEFTSASAPYVYRGDLFSDDYYGNVFICEPAGNLIKRNTVDDDGLILSASNAYPGEEFLASRDERFRPVYITSGPDGALYVADMYRGIIEHGPYMSEYLKEQTAQRKLDTPIHYGRIWRISPKGNSPHPVTSLEGMSAENLVTLLEADNGWYRDEAQRLLVERRERSIVSQLRELMTVQENHLAKIHALWTLEGLGAITLEDCMTAMKDPHPRVRISALRLMDRLLEPGGSASNQVAQMIQSSWSDEDKGVVLHMALAAQKLADNEAIALLGDIITKYVNLPLMRDAVLSSLEDREFDLLQWLIARGDWKEPTADQSIFIEMLATSITRKADEGEILALVNMLEAEGLAEGSANDAILMGMAMEATTNDSLSTIRVSSKLAIFGRENIVPDIQSRLQRLQKLFSWPGKEEQTISQGTKSSLSEAEEKQFVLGRTHYLSTCAQCHGVDGRGVSRFAPPLRASEWVLGDDRRLALLLLHGIEGPIEVLGKTYDAPEILPVMPAHSVMDDNNLAAVMTYIRNAWGNAAPAVSRGTVGSVRHRSQGRVQPWTVEDLDERMLEIDDILNAR